MRKVIPLLTSSAILAMALTTGCIDDPDATSSETEQALTSWGGWRNVAGNTSVSMATVTIAGRLFLFDRASDGSTQVKSFTRGGQWGPARSIGGHTDVGLAATVCWDGIYVIQKGLDGRVYYSNSYDGTGAFSAWTEVPGSGQTNAALSATCLGNGDNGLRVYMKGLDGHVYENTRARTIFPTVQWTGWSGWHEVGDGWVTNVGLGSMHNDYGSNLVLLFKGLNNHSYWKVFRPAGYNTTNGTWTSWREIGGTTDVALAGGGDMAIAKGINDQAGYYNLYNESSDSWSGWSSIGAGTTNAAYAITKYDGGPTSLAFGYYLFAKGINDNGIYLKSNAPLDPPAPPPPPPPPPGTITSTATAYLQQQGGFPGDGVPIAWWTSFGAGIYGGQLKSIANPSSNNFVLYLVKAGHYSSECRDASAVVTLWPGQSTSDMGSLYGVTTPALPVPIVACSSAPVQTLLPISVTYVHQ
jgi:hypothetical protein